jgi:hypothetical protein
MNAKFRFEYSSQAISFLEERIDEDDAYAEATDIFEELVAWSPKLGDPIDRPPPVFRRLPIMIPNLRTLAFYYVIKGKTIEVFKVEFADETPL